MKIGDVRFCVICAEVISKISLNTTCPKCNTFNSLYYVKSIATGTEPFEEAIRRQAEYVDNENSNHDSHVQKYRTKKLLEKVA